MNLLKILFAIITMPIYLPIMFLVGIVLGTLEGIELTADTFESIVR